LFIVDEEGEDEGSCRSARGGVGGGVRSPWEDVLLSAVLSRVAVFGVGTSSQTNLGPLGAARIHEAEDFARLS